MASYFPRRLFFKFFSSLLFLLNLLFVISLGLSAYLFDFSIFSETTALFFFFFFILSILSAAIFSYRFVEPLKRVILKTLRIASKKYVSEFEEEDVLIDEPGEYQELELALDKIRKKLKKRRVQLSHEREESKALMSSMEETIVSIDLNEKLIYFNSKFGVQFLTQDLIRARSEGNSILLTQCLRDPEVLNLFKRSISEGLSQSCQAKLVTQLDSNAKYFSVRVSPLREEKTDAVYGALAVFHDITELKKAEQIRIEFVENASHELRTPLTTVKGYLETLKEDVLGGRLEQTSHFLSIISKNVDRLTELVNDLLTISSLESKSPLKMEIINLQNITEEVISAFTYMASEKKILIKTFSEVAKLKADPLKIEQVLSNLLGNAIKYIQENGVIEIKWQQNKQNEVILTIKDNGAGIAEEHLSRLFERFYRIDKGRSRNVGGTGLGLSIVKHIMQSHGGSVTVKSEIGKGAEFICLFPVHLSQL